MTTSKTLLATLSIAVSGSAAAQSETLDAAYRRHYGTPEALRAAEDAPNLLLITSDQHHWMAVGYNDPRIETPNLDRLARMGVVFDRAYTPNPVSTPARASILTGMYPDQHGAYALGTKLDEGIPTLADYLSAAGYRTALIGKAHFQPLAGTTEYPSAEAYPMLQDSAFWKGFTGPFYGFEHVELARNHGDEAHVGQHYALWLGERAGDRWRAWFRKPTGTSHRQHGSWGMPDSLHMNAWIAARSNRFIEQCAAKGERFFLWASFFDPHPPYLLPEPWASMYDPQQMELPETLADDLSDMPAHYRATRRQTADKSRWVDPSEPYSVHGIYRHDRRAETIRRNTALYRGMISFMDRAIGNILDCLEANGLLDKTLIVFTTDHGHFLGHHGLVGKGVFDYEDAVRIPMLAAYRGVLPSGRRSPALQSLVDLAPTMLSFCGLPKPDRMSGVDQRAVWEGRQEQIRDWVLVQNRFQPTKFYVRTYIEERYKIAYDMNSDEGELFDLQDDPHETTNLWDDPQYASLKAKLLLRALQADMKCEAGMPRIAPA